MSETIILLNQIATNRRLANIEAEMMHQQNAAHLAALRQQKIDEQKEVLFSVKKRLEKLLTMIDSDPKQATYVLNILHHQLKANTITVDSFPELIDKEYASRVFEMMDSIRNSCQSLLSNEEQQDIHELCRLRLGLFHLKKLAVWLEIQEGLPTVPFYKRLTGLNWLFWMVMLIFIEMHVWVNYYAASSLSDKEFWQITTPICILMVLIAIREIWYNILHYTTKIEGSTSELIQRSKS